MNTITFPLFNLKLQISRIAFSIGNINIYWYAILIVSAFIIGVLFCKKIMENIILNLKIF